jgi:hypothetical protein
MIDTETPRDGESLGVFVYNARKQVWVYPAGYSDALLCKRRANALNDAYFPSDFPRWFYVLKLDQEYYAVANAYPEVTAALRASTTPAMAATLTVVRGVPFRLARRSACPRWSTSAAMRRLRASQGRIPPRCDNCGCPSVLRCAVCRDEVCADCRRRDRAGQWLCASCASVDEQRGE